LVFSHGRKNNALGTSLPKQERYDQGSQNDGTIKTTIMQGFEYTNDTIEALESALSPERLNRYVVLANGNKTQKRKHYASMLGIQH